MPATIILVGERRIAAVHLDETGNQVDGAVGHRVAHLALVRLKLRIDSHRKPCRVDLQNLR
jgi:hypothetical protein